MPIILISDLHLTPEAPDTLEHFDRFLETLEGIDSLYILGDLFEYWLGDDASDFLGHTQVEEKLKKLSENSIPVHILPGNRDFLLGPDFARRTGSSLLKGPLVRSFLGRLTMLLHGDCLCTDDLKHQEFRSIVDDSVWRSKFLNKSIKERDKIGRAIRFRSDIDKRYKPSNIMDINEQALETVLQSTGVNLVIHGHTHRPKIHSLIVNNQSVSRVVLGDWSLGPSWIEIRQDNLKLCHGETIQHLTLP